MQNCKRSQHSILVFNVLTLFLDKAGDRICIFGFSRGAYTARGLAGMIHKVCAIRIILTRYMGLTQALV
jgi:uncharacterized protein (DUF2235 family)